MDGGQRALIGRRRWLLGAVVLAYVVQIICFPVNFNGSFFQTLLEFAPWLGREETRWLLGAIGYGLAMGVFAWKAPALPADPERTHLSSLIRRRYPVSGARWGLGLAWVALALGLSGLSMVRFVQVGEDALTRWLWAGSLLVWLIGVGMLGWLQSTASKSRIPALKWRYVLAMTIILAGAGWLRFWQLSHIPDDLHGDMASMGLQARAILAGAAPGLFHQGWASIPMLGFYPSAIGLKFVSNSILGLNFMPAVEGVLTVLGLYLLVWRLFDSHRLAALSAVILSINIPHIHFSRLAAYMDPWPWILFAFFFLVHGLQKRKLWPFAAAGMLLGIAVQMYYSGRVVLLILPLAAIYLIMRYPRAMRTWWRFWLGGALLLGLGGVVALGPSLIYFLQHTGPLLERSRSVFLFHEPVMTHLMGKYGVDSAAAVLWEQIKASVLMFNATYDTSTQFGYTAPLFSAMLSPLVLLGIGYSLRWWRHPGLGFALIWLMAILITGSILTNNAPFWPRLVGILPVAALMAALSLYVTMETLGLVRPMRTIWEPSPSAVAMLAVMLFLLFVGRKNWHAYSAFTRNNARAQARIGRYLDSLPPAIAACSFSQPYRLSERETAFLAWPHRLVDLQPEAAGAALDACPGPNRVWILSPMDHSQLARVQLRWPGGQLRTIRDAAERPVFLSYLLAAGKAERPDGLSLSQRASSAYLPDGSPFIPQKTWLGDASSSTARWRVGPVRARNGRLRLEIGPVAGHDAVFDYVELIDVQGQVRRFEAEDAALTSGDVFAKKDALDNHWWEQEFDPFSGGRALVARKGELVPVLTVDIPLADGLYDLSIGTFTGDPANGVFGLGVAGVDEQ